MTNLVTMFQAEKVKREGDKVTSLAKLLFYEGISPPGSFSRALLATAM